MTSGCVVVTRVLYLVPCIHGHIPFNNNYPPIMDRIVGTRAQTHNIILCTFVKVYWPQLFGSFVAASIH